MAHSDSMPQGGLPEAVDTLFRQAMTHHAAGKSDLAALCHRRILAIAPSHAASLYLLGLLDYRAGRLDEALALLQSAQALGVRHPELYIVLGYIFQRFGNLEKAEHYYRGAIDARDSEHVAHYNLGTVLQAQGQFAEAEACYRRALSLKPAYPEAIGNLAAILRITGRFPEAEHCCHRALAFRPSSPEVLNHLGVVLQAQGRLAEAIAAHRRSIALKPDHRIVHVNLAEALLASGQFAEGWQEYEWRFKHHAIPEQAPPWPQWRGEIMPGQTVLVHAEQGFGDAVQFCRYVPLIVALGMRVVLDVPRPLVRLMRRLSGIADTVVVAHGDPVPPFEYHCPMLSLPLAFGTRLETIPNPTPYLSADPRDVDLWRERLREDGDRFRVGLVWAGNPYRHSPEQSATDRRRSIDVEHLRPLLDCPDVRFYSLQKDGPKAPESLGMIDVMDEMRDFADTAALVANLDLVIAVDTAVAHLAAALGRPVWLLNRADRCWRWLQGWETSPWYPTLRIFSQKTPFHWDDAIDDLRLQLEKVGSVRNLCRYGVP